MAKQLNVNLAFTADTGKAKAQLQDLQKQLSSLVNNTGTDGFAGPITEASKAAAELKVHLQNATNIKTGSLDFTKLNDSIKASGKSLVQYGEQLNSMGPAGQKAFMSLAQSVANSEVPIKRANAALTEMWTTLKNTARWQISSSILHGFMGAIQSAYGYAQDLNESLNNIRIVTGQNIEQMAAFADQANKAAKALSTTTTEYTNASLIYYQQGLSDSEVAERAAVTIKMANVAGQSAETVSDQLTAVWNNFYDGSKSLEYYADVMTSLGAATASSTDEISEGLNKFASVAETVGLSYEYAASALATVTATTRQSADVVGTAFKTLFARLQDLELGEALDDGTTLGKYSEALNAVGVNIKDTNGEMKDMDQILDELGNKWNNLSKDTQVALAQTVAGTRQYTQLVALMDNWDYFQENLDVVQDSEGTLQEQADIYAESWDAASNRVRAALEGIYSSLVDDESFIDILNIIEKIVTYFDNLIDTVGGLSGVLTALGAILTKVFSNQLAKSISNIAYNIKMLKPGAQEAVQQEKANTLREFAGIMAASAGDAGSQAGDTAKGVYTDKLNLQEKMISNIHRMNEAEKQHVQTLMDALSVQEEQTIEAAKQVDIAKNQKSDIASKIYANAAKKDSDNNKNFDTSKAAKSMSNVTKSSSALNQVSNILKNLTKNGDQFENQLYEITQQMQSMANADIGIDFSDDLIILSQLTDQLRSADAESDEWNATLQQIQGLFGKINQQAIDNTATETGSEIEEVRQYSQAVINADNAVNRLDQSQNNLSKSNEKVGETIDQAQGKQKDWADSLVSFANGALSVVSALQMIGGIVDTLEDPDMSGWDKFLSIGSSVLMMVTMLAPTMTSLIGMFGGAGAAAAGATGPVAGFGAALNTALGPIGWVALALTALVAVFAVIITSIDTVSEKAQKRFNQMSEDAKIAADALNEAEDAYNNLQETINSYSEARDNIDSLTKGTEEFKQAVNEANDAARELMETYGVAGTFNAKTGLIEIDDEALEQAEQDSLNDLEEARINNTAAQSNKLMASNDLSNAKVAEKGNKSWMELAKNDINLGAMAGSAAIIAAATAGLGSPIAAVVSGLMVAAGALRGTTEYMNQNENDQEQISALESLQEAYAHSGGNFESAMNSLSADERALIDSLGMTDSELANLCSEVSANTAAILQNNKQLVDANLKNNKEYQDSEHKDELNTLLADELAVETERIYKEKWANGKGIADKKAQQDYADMMGYTWVQNKNNNLGVYSKGDGSENFTVSDETARRALAQKEAMEALGKSVTKYNETLEQVNQTGEKFGDGVGDLMLRMAGGQGASFADATNAEIEALETALADADIATDIISDEDAQNMGYDNAEAYVNALQLGIDSYNDGIANVGASLSDSFTHGFLTNIEDLTLTGAESMGDNLTNAFKLSGSEAANTLDDIFVDAGEDADELSTLLEGVDWGDPNAVAKLNAAIEEQSLDIDTSSDSWEKYTELMSAAGVAMSEVDSKLEQLRSTMSSANSILEDLEVGSIISDEDYEKLTEINPLIKDMFVIAAEGYQFTGSKNDLENLLVGNTKESIAGIKNEFEALSSEGKKLTELNWFDEDGDKVFKSDGDIATIAKHVSDNEGADFDNALAYFGVSKESLQEASDYILDYTDEEGNVDVNAEGFNQDTYDAYLSEVKNVYSQLGAMRQDYLDGAFGENQAEQLIASTATNISELQQLQAEDAIGAEAFNQRLNVLTTEAMNSAESLEDLQNAMYATQEVGGSIDSELYTEALTRLAGEYDECTSSLTDYQRALTLGDEATIANAEDVLTASIMAAEAADKYDLETDDLISQTKAIRSEYDMTAESAAQLAVQNQRMNKGVSALNKDWSAWKKTLKTGNVTTSEYAEALANTTEAVKDLTGVSNDFEISQDFYDAPETFDLITQAANGSETAIRSLRTLLATTAVQDLEIDTTNPLTTVNGETVEEQTEILNDSKQAVIDYITTLNEAVSEGVVDINTDLASIGTEDLGLDTTSFLESLNEMARITGMTVDELNSILNSIGVEAEVNVTKVPVTTKVPITKTVSTLPDPKSKEVSMYEGGGTATQVTGWKTITSLVEVPTINTAAEVKYIGSGSVSESSTQSGSSSKTSDSRQHKSDVVERYKEINDQIDDINRASSKASKSIDRLYGKDRLKQMETANALLTEEIELLEEKNREAEEYLKSDQKELNDALANTTLKLGISAEYDENGNITNVEDILTAVYNKREALLDTFGTTIDETEQEQLEEFDKLIEILTNALSRYEETRELIEDIQDEIEDKFYEWQDNNYEKLQLELELKLEVNDSELQKLEYYLNKYSDNFYKMAESAALMNDKIDPTIQNLEEYKAHKEALDAAYAARQISQEAYLEGLKEVREGYYENLEALIELDKEMMHYYGDTLDAAQAEIDSFTDHMEHLTKVFEHYTSLMEILGKQKDYESMGDFLQGQADTIRDRLDVAKEYYEMLKANSKADEYWANYQAALAEGNDDMAQWWKEQWDAETDALDAAQEEMLSLTEEWAEAMKTVIENNMAKIAETLEKTLTGGTTFDQMMDEFDKLNTRQEEYLTKTNQIYETNKLMRTANKALDETDNKVAKKKLQNFINETKSLQENTQLSEYELELQQAKYDLLLAEIALEEAQNAKSTVRLTRDSEGNYGYVYTADQDAISDAQQAVDDAENKLYNLSLEGQQKYTEKYLQAQQDMYDELTELQQAWIDGEIASEEEYQRRKEEILNHYLGEGGVLQTYSSLYRIACNADADAVADNWQTDYGLMTQSTETWRDAVDQYLEDIKEQTDSWKEVSTQANKDVEGALDNSKDATKELTDESHNLAETIKNEIIPAIEDEIQEVQAQTDAYADQREELLKLIEAYEQYLDALNTQISVASIGFDKDTDYSALMNEYLNKGGQVGDATYNELLKQRNAKIDWLKTEAGGNKGSDYWGTYGDETTAMYEAFQNGATSYKTKDGKVITSDWYTADYVEDEKLQAIFEALGVPLGALEEKVGAIEVTTGEIKASTDAAGEKIENNTNNASSIGDTINATIGDTGKSVTDQILTSEEATNTAITDGIKTISDNIATQTTDLSSKIQTEIGSQTTEISGDIESQTTTLSGRISAAASAISSAIGAELGSIRSSITTLSGRVTNLENVSTFDTGGYTGDWGPQGKLAVLHQKELVLNESDTENLLSTISFIRDIVGMIDSQAHGASLFNMTAEAGITPTTETLEQTVTIHAEFPNATNHNEIEEAFNNLVNRASQYANRK